MESTMVDPQLFDQLKSKIEEDNKVRQELGQITEKLDREVAYAQGVLSRIHSTPRSKCEQPLIVISPPFPTS
jgi:hypothetical protein